MSRKSLHIEIRVGESVSIDNGRVVLTLQQKSGQRARLQFDAEQGAPIEPLRVRAAADPARKGIPEIVK